jgi:hypothetical protein
MTELTAKQAKIVAHIKAEILNARYGRTAGSYEIKRFEVTLPREGSDLAFLIVETGMRNDEGTLASMLCRDRRHVMIGPNGGTELLNAKKRGRTINRGLWHVLHNLVEWSLL